MKIRSTRTQFSLSFGLLGLSLLGGALCAPSAQAIGIKYDITCSILPNLFPLYLSDHYVYKKMTDELKSRTIDQFIKTLDPSKSLFYQSEVTELKTKLLGVFKSSSEYDCAKLNPAIDLMNVRMEESEKWVKEYLNANYKLNEATELVTDADLRDYPKNAADRKALQQKIVDVQMANRLYGIKSNLEESKKSVIHSYELATKRAREQKTNSISELAESFAVSLDPHTSYMSPEVLEEFKIQMNLSLEGIGATLSNQDGFTVIEELVPGGAADRTKTLQPKDKIIAVGQEGKKPESVIDMDLKDVVRQIRGKKGTKVTLKVMREGKEAKTFDLVITRDKINIEDAAAKISYVDKKIDGKSVKIGVIDLPSFYGEEDQRSCSQDVKKLLLEAKKKNVGGIVLDLSRNGGGLLEEAVRIAGLFIKTGAVVATKGDDTHVDVFKDKDPEVAYTGPLAVLTSRYSASASEILAGALKDYHRALIVGGDHTFGKGTVQVVKYLPLGMGATKVSTGMYFIPGGDSTQHTGVISDITIPSLASQDEVGEKKMDYSLPPQKIEPFLSMEVNGVSPSDRFAPVSESEINKLRKESEARVAASKEFDEVKKSIEEYRASKGKLKIAEFKKKLQEQDKKDAKTKSKSRKQKMKEENSPQLDEAVDIMTDFIAVRAKETVVSHK